MQKSGALFGSRYIEDHSILGSILGLPIYGNLPMAILLLSPCVATHGPPSRDTDISRFPQNWVAVKELKSSYQNPETIMIYHIHIYVYVYPHYGNLHKTP